MANAVKSFMESKRRLLKYFGCEEDYFIKTLDKVNWEINEDGGAFFITYWGEGIEKTSAVTLKRNDNPLVYMAGGYTMVIAIDCVKTAFIFSDSLRAYPRPV